MERAAGATMSDPRSSTASSAGPPVRGRAPTGRDSKQIAAATALPRVPRWGFFKGLLAGAVIEVPALAGAVWAIAHLGAGDPAVPFMRVLRLTAIFAGIAAVLTAGGLGRLAAHASVTGGRRRAAWVAGRAHAVAGVALVIIAALPHGHIPARGAIWLLYPLAGVIVGAACGVVIGVTCGGAAPVGIGDVWTLAKLPADMLTKIVPAEDLARIGSAIRQRGSRAARRTTQVFDGMFDPAPPAPTTVPPRAPARAEREAGPDDGGEHADRDDAAAPDRSTPT